jgi:hypothetical protein
VTCDHQLELMRAVTGSRSAVTTLLGANTVEKTLHQNSCCATQLPGRVGCLRVPNTGPFGQCLDPMPDYRGSLWLCQLLSHGPRNHQVAEYLFHHVDGLAQREVVNAAAIGNDQAHR